MRMRMSTQLTVCSCALAYKSIFCCPFILFGFLFFFLLSSFIYLFRLRAGRWTSQVSCRCPKTGQSMSDCRNSNKTFIAPIANYILTTSKYIGIYLALRMRDHRNACVHVFGVSINWKNPITFTFYKILRRVIGRHVQCNFVVDPLFSKQEKQTQTNKKYVFAQLYCCVCVKIKSRRKYICIDFLLRTPCQRACANEFITSISGSNTEPSIQFQLWNENQYKQ